MLMVRCIAVILTIQLLSLHNHQLVGPSLTRSMWRSMSTTINLGRSRSSSLTTATRAIAWSIFHSDRSWILKRECSLRSLACIAVHFPKGVQSRLTDGAIAVGSAVRQQ